MELLFFCHQVGSRLSAGLPAACSLAVYELYSLSLNVSSASYGHWGGSEVVGQGTPQLTGLLWELLSPR